MEDEISDVEYTLEDALATLKDTEAERREVVDDLLDAVRNTGSAAANTIGDAEDIRRKQHKLTDCLLKQIRQVAPKDYAISGTSELHLEVLTELKEEVGIMLEHHGKMEERLADIKSDISYLEEKKMGLAKMKEAGLNAAEQLAKTNYTKANIETKRLFKAVRDDLHVVVSTVFQQDEEFTNLLAELTMQYTNDQEKSYIEVTPELWNFVHFLYEADLIKYGNKEKTMIKLVDLE